MAKNITIEKKGDYLKVKRNDVDTVHRYLLVDVDIEATGKKFIITEKGGEVETFHYNEVMSPEANSFSDLFDLIHALITTTSASGLLNGVMDYLSISVNDNAIANGALAGITEAHYFLYTGFSDSVNQNIRVGILVPDDFDPDTNPELRFKVFPAVNQDTLSSKNFKFEAAVKHITDEEVVTQSDDETKTVVVSVDALYGTSEDAAITLTGSKIKAGDFIGVRFTRLTTDPKDNRNGDANVYSMSFNYREL